MSKTAPGAGSSARTGERSPAPGRDPQTRVLFRPLLVSGMLAKGDGGDMYILVDDEQSESEQVIALWHETLHLLGLLDETQVEAMAQRLAVACPEIVQLLKGNTQ